MNASPSLLLAKWTVLALISEGPPRTVRHQLETPAAFAAVRTRARRYPSSNQDAKGNRL